MGTTAEIWLPATTAAAKSKVSVPQQVETKLAAMTLLVVDDDVLVLNNTVAMLEEAGHHVLAAESGEAALALFETNPQIDLVITDHAMPHMTGAQLIQMLKTRAPQLPMIIATGYAELPESIANSVLKLAKPFNEAQLVAVMSKAIDRERLPASVVPFRKP